jgi:hypothetical protein
MHLHGKDPINEMDGSMGGRLVHCAHDYLCRGRNTEGTRVKKEPGLEGNKDEHQRANRALT